MSRVLDITYKEVDFELVPESLLGGWPTEAIRLNLSNYTPLIIMVSSFVIYYLILIPFVFPSTKPFGEASINQRKKFRDIHNLFFCLYSGFCCFSTAFSLGYKLLDWHSLLCDPVEGTWLRPLSVTFTISKIIEWIDTAFIVWLGKNPPGFLHTYHHATTFWLFCFVSNFPGPEKFGMLLNGFVHTLMYSHYYRSWPKPLVPIITVLQIGQLSLVTYAWTVSPAECPNAAFTTAPTYHLLEYLTPYTMVPVFLWLFIVFFVKRFILLKPKGETKKKQ